MNTSICPICRASRFVTLAPYAHVGLAKYGCSLVRCQSCSHVFTATAGDADLSELYASEQYELVDTRQSLFGRLIAFDVKAALRHLTKVKPPQKGASLMDFGCGKGVFLHFAMLHGWQVKGIETAPRRAAFARSTYGLDVTTDDYAGGMVRGGPFDVVTLFHVLEHLPNPKALLTSLVQSNLKDGGILVVEVPRFDSLQSGIAGHTWIHLDPPRHLSHFTTASLSQMMRDLGFRIIAKGQFSFHNGLLGMVQGVLSRVGYRKMLIEELKLRRTLALVLLVAAVLPLAAALETIAVLLGRGGIVRLYCTRSGRGQYPTSPIV